LRVGCGGGSKPDAPRHPTCGQTRRQRALRHSPLHANGQCGAPTPGGANHRVLDHVYPVRTPARSHRLPPRTTASYSQTTPPSIPRPSDCFARICASAVLASYPLTSSSREPDPSHNLGLRHLRPPNSMRFLTPQTLGTRVTVELSQQDSDSVPGKGHHARLRRPVVAVVDRSQVLVLVVWPYWVIRSDFG